MRAHFCILTVGQGGGYAVWGACAASAAGVVEGVLVSFRIGLAHNSLNHTLKQP